MLIRPRLMFALCFLAASAAQAQVTPLIFERESIRIESPTLPETTEKESSSLEKPANSSDKNVIAPHAPLVFDIEIRPEDALRLEYIHSLNTLTATTGVMIAFTAPSVLPLPRFQAPTPVDALFIANNGTISQILPNVVLSEIKQEIIAQGPVKAFLFLKAGSVKAQGIHPKDIVISKKFVPIPGVLK